MEASLWPLGLPGWDLGGWFVGSGEVGRLPLNPCWESFREQAIARPGEAILREPLAGSSNAGRCLKVLRLEANALIRDGLHVDPVEIFSVGRNRQRYGWAASTEYRKDQNEWLTQSKKFDRFRKFA